LTGERLWIYAPNVSSDFTKLGCSDVVNCGVAYHDGKNFIAAYDRWIQVIEAKTGNKKSRIMELYGFFIIIKCQYK
jgi:hypothetical protein